MSAGILKTRAVAETMPSGRIREEDGALFFPVRDPRDPGVRAASVAFDPDNEGRWTYTSASGTRVASTYTYGENPQVLAQWTRERIMELDPDQPVSAALHQFKPYTNISRGDREPSLYLWDGHSAWVDTQDGPTRGTWLHSQTTDRIRSASGLPLDAHPAAVAAWVTEAGRTDPDYLRGAPRDVVLNGVTKAVVAHVEGAESWDEGAGEAIWFGSRSNGAHDKGDYAYISRDDDPTNPGVWHFETEQTETPDAKGDYCQNVVSNLGAGEDPAVVAAWINEQAQRFCSVHLRR
ncbi:hypothetical protein HF998_01105 [Cellulomonas hominis]|uniref:Uncharacterized protein n=1 Tax=Cellulomonas hominis TaxID=156981 RepID=A0A7W8SIB3_9CELL|nr:hypothetical protein [Cellulomonas hominis]MBB5474555.1 hypothetical protein [Cellulomonas hominis]NKY05607.1 hypothetical protein [Cellulomonas hominis]